VKAPLPCLDGNFSAATRVGLDGFLNKLMKNLGNDTERRTRELLVEQPKKGQLLRPSRTCPCGQGKNRNTFSAVIGPSEVEELGEGERAVSGDAGLLLDETSRSPTTRG